MQRSRGVLQSNSKGEIEFYQFNHVCLRCNFKFGIAKIYKGLHGNLLGWSRLCTVLKLKNWWQAQDFLIIYSRVHKSLDGFFSKILEKPSIVQKKMIPHIKWLDFSQRWSKKKFKMADLENSKWPPQKKLIFQLRQFSIFFRKNFMDWSFD